MNFPVCVFHKTLAGVAEVTSVVLYSPPQMGGSSGARTRVKRGFERIAGDIDGKGHPGPYRCTQGTEEEEVPALALMGHARFVRRGGLFLVINNLRSFFSFFNSLISFRYDMPSLSYCRVPTCKLEYVPSSALISQPSA
jgi:hypothetical protein